MQGFQVRDRRNLRTLRTFGEWIFRMRFIRFINNAGQP
jgi:hypothetical protein